MSNAPTTAQTAREWLSTIVVDGKPLAVAGARGRFSAAATAALAEAQAAGVVFTPSTPVKAAKAPKPVSLVKPVVKQARPAVSVSTLPTVNAKEVRAWAITNGVNVGARGRLHPDVISAFIAAGGKPSDSTVSTAAVQGGLARPTPAGMPKIRPNTQAWAIVKHRLDKPSHRPIVLGTGTCHKGHNISSCPCDVPMTTEQWGSVPLVFEKPTL